VPVSLSVYLFSKMTIPLFLSAIRQGNGYDSKPGTALSNILIEIQ